MACLIFLCSASQYPGSWVLSRWNLFLKNLLCPRTSEYICTLQLSAFICSVVADLSLLALKAQPCVCQEVTHSQQSIPSSSCEHSWFSFWSFAHASIRTTAGTSLASSDATSHSPPPTPNLSFLFLVLVYTFGLYPPFLNFLAPFGFPLCTSKTASASIIPSNPSLPCMSYTNMQQTFNP